VQKSLLKAVGGWEGGGIRREIDGRLYIYKERKRRITEQTVSEHPTLVGNLKPGVFTYKDFLKHFLYGNVTS
jgi:hypothetical protein